VCLAWSFPWDFDSPNIRNEYAMLASCSWRHGRPKFSQPGLFILGECMNCNRYSSLIEYGFLSQDALWLFSIWSKQHLIIRCHTPSKVQSIAIVGFTWCLQCMVFAIHALKYWTYWRQTTLFYAFRPCPHCHGTRHAWNLSRVSPLWIFRAIKGMVLVIAENSSGGRTSEHLQYFRFRNWKHQPRCV